jgi:hypothetical protein
MSLGHRIQDRIGIRLESLEKAKQIGWRRTEAAAVVENERLSRHYRAIEGLKHYSEESHQFLDAL